MVSQVALVRNTDVVRDVARELKEYDIEELDAVSIRLIEAAAQIDAHIVDKVTEAYAAGVAAGRESMKAEIAAKEPIRSPASRIVRVGGLRKRV